MPGRRHIADKRIPPWGCRPGMSHKVHNCCSGVQMNNTEPAAEEPVSSAA